MSRKAEIFDKLLPMKLPYHVNLLLFNIVTLWEDTEVLVCPSIVYYDTAFFKKLTSNKVHFLISKNTFRVSIQTMD